MNLSLFLNATTLNPFRK